jgi:hypothetical protein
MRAKYGATTGDHFGRTKLARKTQSFQSTAIAAVTASASSTTEDAMRLWTIRKRSSANAEYAQCCPIDGR